MGLGLVRVSEPRKLLDANGAQIAQAMVLHVVPFQVLKAKPDASNSIHRKLVADRDINCAHGRAPWAGTS